MHIHKLLGIRLVPLTNLVGHHAGHPLEVAQHEAQSVNHVAGGDGQGICAHGGVTLPGAAGLPIYGSVANVVTVQVITSPT